MTGLGCIGRITYDRIKTGLTQCLIQRRAHSFSGDRGRINFPVSGVQHLAHRCANQQPVGLRRTVRDGHPSDLKRTQLHLLACRHSDNRCIESFFSQFSKQYVTGKACRINGTPELLPQMSNRTDMVFMGMSRYQCHQRLCPVADE